MKLDSATFFSKDLEKSIKFFRDVLGLKLEYQQGDRFVSFLFENGVRLSVKRPTENREIPGSQTIFIQSDNATADYAKMKEKNLNFTSELEENSWGNFFSISDPDGNKIGFIERK